MEDQEFCTLNRVPMSEFHIGQIIFDKDGQLFVIVSIELALPRNEFSSIHVCRDNTLLAISANGAKRRITAWRHWTGTTDFDNHYLLGVSLDMVTIKQFLERLHNIKSFQ
jgi:hypothetical protein